MASDNITPLHPVDGKPWCPHLEECKHHAELDSQFHEAGEKIGTWAEGLRDLLHNVVLRGDQEECDLGLAILVTADATLWAIATQARIDVEQQTSSR